MQVRSYALRRGNKVGTGLLLSLLSLSLAAAPLAVHAGPDATASAVMQDGHAMVKGRIVDANGEAIIGANVVEEGTTNGTITDFDGYFSLNVAQGARLVISYVGYTSQTVDAKPDMKITLREDSELLGEVVVTAMGIERKAETLTYTQTVGGNELTRAKEANLINSLQGKTAGLTITPNAGGAGGASKILLRGNASMLGNNSPLIVIDGVPMQNSVSGQMNMSDGGYSIVEGGSSEGSDALSQLNPDDIESITVLKGANSAALYGSAASNGVLMITTKRGREGGLRVDVSSSTTFETPLVLPELQNIYGAQVQGNSENGWYVPSQSWGDKLGGLTADQLANPNNPNVHLSNTPYDISDFYQLGTNFNNSVSLSGGTKTVQTYFSYGNTTANGIVETNKFTRHNLSFRQNYSFFDGKLKIDISANYINQKTKNRPTGGTYFNPIYQLYMAPRNLDMDWYRHNYTDYNGTWMSNTYDALVMSKDANGNDIYVLDQIQSELSSPAYGKQIWYDDNINLNNPWWLLNRLTSEEVTNRFFGSFSATYHIIDGLSVQARLKYDYNERNDEQRQYATTWHNAGMIDRGRLILDHSKGYDFYGDFMFSYNKDIKDFNIGLNFGGSMLNSRSNYWRITPTASSGAPYQEDLSTNQFVLDDIYISSGDNYGGLETNNWERALFATAQLTWREMLTVEGSYRDDWYRAFTQFRDMKPHFAYWSVGANAHLGKMFTLPEFMNDFKVRASYSVVGNSIPNQLFLASATRNPATGAYVASGIVNFKDPKPETTGSFEAGFDLSMFGRSFNIEATYYNAIMKNQFMRYQGSAGKEVYINGGKVRNQGVELTASYILAPNNNFSWKTQVNYSFNANKILTVAKKQNGLDFIYEVDMGKNSGLKVKFQEGGSYGDLYAVDYMRNSEGEIVVNSDGLPYKMNGQSNVYLGNMNAKHTLGWANTFNYKDFTFYFLIDGKIGGKVISFTEAYLDQAGNSVASAEARLNAEANNIVWTNKAGTVSKPGMIVEGQVIPIYEYYQATGGQAPLGSNYVYDGTNFRLREISLGYTFRDLFGKSKNLTLAVNARNLFFLYKDAPIDPETSLSTQNALGNVDVFSMPTTRSFGITIKASF